MIPKVDESPAPPDGEQKEVLAPNGRPWRKRAMRWLATTTILVAIGFASLLLGGIYQFGSAASALAYLRGDGLIPDAYTKSFGIAAGGEIRSLTFSLKNWTKQPIKVLGASSSCTCLVTSDLPAVVPPMGRLNLRVSARAKSGLGPYSERIHLFTDPGGANLRLYVRGYFSLKLSEAIRKGAGSPP
jgi:hypothetical protein